MLRSVLFDLADDRIALRQQLVNVLLDVILDVATAQILSANHVFLPSFSWIPPRAANGLPLHTCRACPRPSHARSAARLSHRKTSRGAIPSTQLAPLDQTPLRSRAVS